jgi:hypothetical protein
MNSFQAIRPRSSNPNEDDSARRPSLNGELAVSVGKGRKRKAPAHVSQNACTNCKKARAKVSQQVGGQSAPLLRCSV